MSFPDISPQEDEFQTVDDTIQNQNNNFNPMDMPQTIEGNDNFSPIMDFNNNPQPEIDEEEQKRIQDRENEEKERRKKIEEKMELEIKLKNENREKAMEFIQQFEE